MTDTKTKPRFQSAIEPFTDLQGRVERLEREAKNFRWFCGSIAILWTIRTIVSLILKLVWG